MADAVGLGSRPPPRYAGRLVRREPAYALGAPRGFLSSLLLCAVRTAQSLSSKKTMAAVGDGDGRRVGAAAAGHRGATGGVSVSGGVSGGGGDVSGGGVSWGLLVLSDAPALPSLATHLPSLAGRVVSTAGAGQLGHSSFDRSCSSKAGKLARLGRLPNPSLASPPP